MRSWRDLEREFGELASAMPDARLERQWNDRTEEWRLAGAVPLQAARTFHLLAASAGSLLVGPGVDVPAEVSGEADAEKRWYRALWFLAGPHDAPVVGMMSSFGAAAGSVSVGRIRTPAQTSADLAARFQDAGPA